MSKGRTGTASRKAKAKPRLKRKGASEDEVEASRAVKTDTAIYLTEDDVCRLVTVKDAIATLEDLFATWSDPATVNLPRQRAPAGGSAFNLMGAAWGAKALFGLKAYFVGGSGARFHVLLYSARDSSLKAMIEADHLGQMRTGAASGRSDQSLGQAGSPHARRYRCRPAGVHPSRRGLRGARDYRHSRVQPARSRIATASRAASSASSASPHSRPRPPRPRSARPMLSSPSPNRRSRCCARTG